MLEKCFNLAAAGRPETGCPKALPTLPGGATVELLAPQVAARAETPGSLTTKQRVKSQHTSGVSDPSWERLARRCKQMRHAPDRLVRFGEEDPRPSV